MQVKSNRGTRGAIAQLIGDALTPHPGKLRLFYASAYGHPDSGTGPIPFAESEGVALFQFDLQAGEVQAANRTAEALLEYAAALRGSR